MSCTLLRKGQCFPTKVTVGLSASDMKKDTSQESLWRILNNLNYNLSLFVGVFPCSSQKSVTSLYPGKGLPNHSSPVPISEMGKLRQSGLSIFSTYTLTHSCINEICDARRKDHTQYIFIWSLLTVSYICARWEGKSCYDFLKNVFLNVLLNKLLLIKTLLLLLLYYY